MKCPKCRAENPETRKFCRECGSKLILVCPKCGVENLPGDKFCGECGHNLTLPSEPTPRELSYDEKIEKIRRYLPEGLTEKILSQRDKIEGERKQVTVMFCDMEGFTTLVEKLGPEEAYTIMDQIYEILIHKVHDYEGTVNEMTGDGIMALFGAPIALEDASQRAIRSAMAIHREITRFNERVKQQKGDLPPVKMRVGIHTGPAVVGTLGNDLRVEFKAVGDTVNLASRMESIAEPGTTCISDDTFKLTESLFRFEALGEKEIKGKHEPVNVYRVIAPSTRRTRFDVSAERGLTPFVGRERELELLLDDFERSKGGRGQAFSIVSEAGVGKSRLLYEFRKAVASEDVTFLEGRCLSYSRGISYHPVIDILKSNFDIREGDCDAEIREKVQRGLRILAVDEPSTIPYLLELLLVKDSGIDQIPMSPEERRVRITNALTRIVLKGSEIRPLIMAFEDLHWMDKSSEEVSKYLLECIPGARVFLIFTYRPEYVRAWGARSYHSQVTLNRLSNRESLAMATYLLGTEELDRNLEDLILEKTEGVPFFIEEFIKSLMDLKIIEKENNRYRVAKGLEKVTIPSTIQDVIMARVDSLPEGAKEVLQTGSVIEREFSYELIKRVTGLPEKELLSRLSALKDSELLYERGIYPQSTYIFKHALTQEVVYDSILIKKKKQFHEEIGNATEEVYKENIDQHYGILAEHFIESENYEKGAEYAKLAGKKAEKAASLNDAIEYAAKRVACLESLSKTDDMDKSIIDARTALGLYYVQINYHVAAKEAVDPIIDLATKHASKRRLSQIYSIVGSYNCWVEEDLSRAFRYLEDAVRISEEISDVVSLFFGCFWLAVALSLSCEFEKAYQNFKKALDINVMTKRLWGIASLKSNISFWVYCLKGSINLAHETSRESLQIANESGDILSKGMAYASYGTSCYFKGVLDEAEHNLLKGLEFSEKTAQIGWAAVAAYSLGETYSDMEEYKKAEKYYAKAISFLEQSRLLPSFKNLNSIGIARAMVMNNEKGIGLESLYGYVHENKIKLYDGWMPRYIANILLNIDDQHMPDAEDWIKKAIEADKRNGIMFNLGRDYSLHANLFNRKGAKSKAKESLIKAIEIYKECGADGWVKKTEKELAALSK
jgi:class 3 adenylate cyclase/tetratricopeptide (TPR) repeat protein